MGPIKVLHLLAVFFIYIYSQYSVALGLKCVDALSSYNSRGTDYSDISQIKYITVATYNLDSFYYPYPEQKKMNRPQKRAKEKKFKKKNKEKARQFNTYHHARRRANQSIGKVRKSSATRLAGIANTIYNLNADILSLQEVVLPESMEHFNEVYLNNDYFVFYTRSNERTYTITLVRKNLMRFLDVEVQSHLRERWIDPAKDNKEVPVFLRDLLQLNFYIKGSYTRPLFSVFNTHLKSARSRDFDPKSQMWREEQVKRTVSIIQKLQMEYGTEMPIIELGDHNGDVNYWPEFQLFYQSAHMFNTQHFLWPKKHREERATFTYHPREKQTAEKRELDVIYLSKGHEHLLVNGDTMPYYTLEHEEKSLPETLKERGRQPSDHRAVYVQLDFQELLKTKNR